MEYYGFRYHIWALRLTFPYSPFFDLSKKYPLRSRLTKIAMKTILRKCWVKYVSSIAEIFPWWSANHMLTCLHLKFFVWILFGFAWLANFQQQLTYTSPTIFRHSNISLQIGKWWKTGTRFVAQSLLILKMFVLQKSTCKSIIDTDCPSDDEELFAK